MSSGNIWLMTGTVHTSKSLNSILKIKYFNTKNFLKIRFYLALLSGKRTNKYRAKYIRPNTIDVLNTVGVVVCGWTKVLFLDRCGSSLKDKSPKVHFYKQNLNKNTKIYSFLYLYNILWQYFLNIILQIRLISLIKNEL